MSDSPSLRTPNTTAQGGEAHGETMNEPFAAIPLLWGLSKEPYHRFLMWLAFKMSGTDGFSGLESGQVRFSIRDVELEFSTSFWAARGWVERAKAENLLKPTASFKRSKGSGEVYSTDGLLLKTRRSTTDQQPINNRSTKRKKTNDLATPEDQQPINNRSTTDRYKDETKKTKKTINPPEEKETVASILQWDNLDYSSMFWTTFKPWPPNRRMNNLTLAKRYREALRAGVDATALYTAVQNYSGSCKPEFMKEASKWMEEEGWRAYEVGTGV